MYKIGSKHENGKRSDSDPKLHSVIKTDHGDLAVHSRSVSCFQLRSPQTGHGDLNITYRGQYRSFTDSSTWHQAEGEIRGTGADW